MKSSKIIFLTLLVAVCCLTQTMAMFRWKGKNNMSREGGGSSSSREMLGSSRVQPVIGPKKHVKALKDASELIKKVGEAKKASRAEGIDLYNKNTVPSVRNDFMEGKGYASNKNYQKSIGILESYEKKLSKEQQKLYDLQMKEQDPTLQAQLTDIQEKLSLARSWVAGDHPHQDTRGNYDVVVYLRPEKIHARIQELEAKDSEIDQVLSQLP